MGKVEFNSGLIEKTAIVDNDIVLLFDSEEVDITKQTKFAKRVNVNANKEDVSNKETLSLDSSTTKYPCNNVVKTAIKTAIDSATLRLYDDRGNYDPTITNLYPQTYAGNKQKVLGSFDLTNPASVSTTNVIFHCASDYFTTHDITIAINSGDDVRSLVAIFIGQFMGLHSNVYDCVNVPAGSFSFESKAFAPDTTFAITVDVSTTGFIYNGITVQQIGEYAVLGSGTNGAILKGDIWTISQNGAMNSVNVLIGYTVRALQDNPASNVNTNWCANVGLGYVPLKPSNNLSDIGTRQTALNNLTNVSGGSANQVIKKVGTDAVWGDISIANPIVWLNATLGNDSTGVRGDENKPFLTPEAARDAALSGDTIYVNTGVYAITTTAINGLSKDGVQWFLPYGAIFNKATSGHMFNNSSTFTLPSNVFGLGQFNKTVTSGAIYLTTRADKDIFEAHTVYSSGGTACIITNASGFTKYKVLYGYNTLYFVMYGMGNTSTSNVDVEFIEWKSDTSSTIYIDCNTLKLKGLKLTSLTSITFFCSQIINLDIDVSYIIGVGYGIQLAANRYSLIKCAYTTGIYQLEGQTSFIGYAKYLRIEARFTGGKCLEATLGQYSNCEITIEFPYSEYPTKFTQTGGNCTLHVGHCNAAMQMNITGGRTNIVSWMDGGSNGLAWESRIINGGDVTISCPIKAGLINAASNIFKLISGSLYISNLLQNLVTGGTDDAFCSGIEYQGGKLVINGRVVLNSTKGIPIRATAPSLELRVPTVYATNRVINNIAGIHKKSKLSITAIAATSITLNDGAAEVFTEADTTTYNTKGKLAQRIAALINASGTLDITASQDNAGVDEYLWITSDNYYDYSETSLSNITTILESMNSYPYTEIAGGTINENINVE